MCMALRLLLQPLSMHIDHSDLLSTKCSYPPFFETPMQQNKTSHSQLPRVASLDKTLWQIRYCTEVTPPPPLFFILKGPFTSPTEIFGYTLEVVQCHLRSILPPELFKIASLLETGEIELSHKFPFLVNRPCCYSLSFYSPTPSLLLTVVQV